ncbi:MAG: hypothetical protein NTZ56_10785 [Acidobacteria bacterium]|nr:hypothetical protein [Acidobacteriota bacterium]
MTEAAELLSALQPVSGPHFRRLLRESGVPLAPLVEGVRQDTLDQLERTLLALLDEPEARRLVIEAKDHARMAQRRAPTPEREEKLLWMTVWLENRPLFRDWLRLRRAKLQANSGAWFVELA